MPSQDNVWQREVTWQIPPHLNATLYILQAKMQGSGLVAAFYPGQGDTHEILL